MTGQSSAPPPVSPLRVRLCPSCDLPLVVFELEGVEVECCMKCRGVWLDAAELEAICLGPEGASLDHGANEGVRVGLLQAIGAGREEKKSERRRCPRCRRRLRSLRLPGEPGAVIGHCPKRHGFWFHRGELETLVKEYPEGHAGTIAKFLHELFRHDLRNQTQEVDNE